MYEGGHEKKKEVEGITFPTFDLAMYKRQGGNVYVRVAGNFGCLDVKLKLPIFCTFFCIYIFLRLTVS